MKLQRLRLSNFLSFENASISLSNRGLLLISGKNGSGKSSFFSKAITWGLFGQTPDGIKGDSVIRIGEKTSEIELSLEGLMIIRGRPHSLQFLTPNADDYIEFRNATEAQEFINNKIQRDFTTFINADYFGQGRKSNFINESPRLQLEVLEEILGLNKLDRVIELIKKRIIEWTEICDRERATKLRLGAELDSYCIQKKSLASRLKGLSDELEQEQQTLKQYEIRKANESARVSGLNIVILKDSAQAKKDFIKELEAISHTSKIEVKEFTNQISMLGRQIKTIKENICPTCEQQVDVELTNKLKEDQSFLKRSIAEKQSSLSLAINKRDRSLINLSSAKKELDEINKEIAKIESIHTNYDPLISSVKNSINDKISKISLLDEQIKKTQNIIAETSDWLEESKSQLIHYENNVQILKFWQEIFSKDFKNFVIRETLPFIEERTRYHLNLLNNGHIDIKFSTIKELKSGEERSLFNINCKVKNGGSEYSSLSGGEKQIASFAVGLTLSELVDMQNGSPSNIMILDEPFTELDGPNCENVVNYLINELSKKKETIILISNDDRMKSLVSNVIEIEKDENGISRINE